MSPRACRTLRGLHEGTSNQRSAACLRGGREPGLCPPGGCPFSSGAPIAAITSELLAQMSMYRLRRFCDAMGVDVRHY